MLQETECTRLSLSRMCDRDDRLPPCCANSACCNCSSSRFGRSVAQMAPAHRQLFTVFTGATRETGALALADLRAVLVRYGLERTDEEIADVFQSAHSARASSRARACAFVGERRLSLSRERERGEVSAIIQGVRPRRQRLVGLRRVRAAVRRAAGGRGHRARAKRGLRAAQTAPREIHVRRARAVHRPRGF